MEYTTGAIVKIKDGLYADKIGEIKGSCYDLDFKLRYAVDIPGNRSKSWLYFTADALCEATTKEKLKYADYQKNKRNRAEGIF